LDQTIVIGAEDFHDDYLRHLAGEFVTASKSFRLAMLQVYTDEGEANVSRSGKLSTHTTFGGWRHLYDEMQYPVAETVVTRDGAVHRVRYRNGVVRKEVLNGKDPLTLWVRGMAFEVLKFILWVPWNATRLLSADQVTIRAYLVTPTLIDAGIAKAVSSVIVDKLGVRDTLVYIRNDIWFVDETHFPIFYPFSIALPPTYEEYQKTTTWLCLPEKKEWRCTEHSGAEK
jgi:hypothetical protein